MTARKNRRRKARARKRLEWMMLKELLPNGNYRIIALRSNGRWVRRG